MEEYRFNCPRDLAQKFWVVCRAEADTPGAALRSFILKRVEEYEEVYGPMNSKEKKKQLEKSA